MPGKIQNSYRQACNWHFANGADAAAGNTPKYSSSALQKYKPMASNGELLKFGTYPKSNSKKKLNFKPNLMTIRKQTNQAKIKLLFMRIPNKPILSCFKLKK